MQPNSTPLTDLTNALDDPLPDTTQQFAELLYNKTTPLHNGRSKHAIAAATIYLAAKQTNTAIDPDDLTTTDHTDITRTYLLNLAKQIKRELNLSINLYNPNTYIDTYADELSLPSETTTLAKHIATETTDIGLASGNAPTTVAAASVYYACLLTNAKHTQQEVSDVAMTTPTTIRALYKQQQEHLDVHQNTLNQ